MVFVLLALKQLESKCTNNCRPHMMIIAPKFSAMCSGSAIVAGMHIDQNLAVLRMPETSVLSLWCEHGDATLDREPPEVPCRRISTEKSQPPLAGHTFFRPDQRQYGAAFPFIDCWLVRMLACRGRPNLLKPIVCSTTLPVFTAAFLQIQLQGSRLCLILCFISPYSIVHRALPGAVST